MFGIKADVQVGEGPKQDGAADCGLFAIATYVAIPWCQLIYMIILPIIHIPRVAMIMYQFLIIYCIIDTKFFEAINGNIWSLL